MQAQGRQSCINRFMQIIRQHALHARLTLPGQPDCGKALPAVLVRSTNTRMLIEQVKQGWECLHLIYNTVVSNDTSDSTPEEAIASHMRDV